jgi:glycosyltransferase involved in cell wall biosynthesis
MNEGILPLISVIIPTRNRPHLVCRAVESVLSQTITLIEVLVVLDGPDDVTAKQLETIQDARLQVIVLPRNCGAAGARKFGIEQARGEWIACLDDDDSWEPRKLEYQLNAAQQSNFDLPVVYSCFTADTPKGKFVWPRRLPERDEPVSEYLFTRRSLVFWGETFLNTSTLFAKRELLMKVPFDTTMYKHEDWNWVLQVSVLEGVGIEVTPEPLAITEIRFEKPSGRSSGLSDVNDWSYSLLWIRSVRHLITPRAYSSFMLAHVGSQAAREYSWNQFFPILWEALRLGQPRLIDYLSYVLNWLTPRNAKQAIRGFLNQSATQARV